VFSDRPDKSPHGTRTYPAAHSTGSLKSRSIPPSSVQATPDPLHSASDFRLPVQCGKRFTILKLRKSAANSPVDFICDEPNPLPMVKKKTKHDPQWAKTKNVCRLKVEDIRMAKELDISEFEKKQPQPKSVVETAGEGLDWPVV
jgi:hypothetical protein